MCVYVYVCIYKCIYYFLLNKYFPVALFVYFQLNQSAVAGVEREPAQGTSPHTFLSRQTSHPRRGQQRNRVPGMCCHDSALITIFSFRVNRVPGMCCHDIHVLL